MYNRYVPQPDGSYRKQVEADSLAEPAIQISRQAELLPPLSTPAPVQNTLSSLTNGDLMTLLSMLLIASEGDEHRTTALLTLVFYFLT